MKIFFYICIFFVTFLSVFQRTQSLEIYELAFEEDGKSKLYWNVDYQKKVIRFEIHISLEKNSWFGIGFSDFGDIKSADFCIFWTDWQNQTYLNDVWTSENGRILVDEFQDCLNFRFTFNKNKVVFTFSRKFKTCDPYDYEIEDGTTNIVWVKGKGPLYQLRGVNIFSAYNYGFERTQLLKTTENTLIKLSYAKTLEILTNKVKVPETETTYWCHVQELPLIFIKKHHIVQYEPVIQKYNEHLVHHMEVFHCQADKNETIPLYEGSCFDDKRPKKTKTCSKVLAAWAMGAKKFSYPEEVGLPIGGPNFNRFVMLEIHYNNPEKRTGIIDSSGIKFYITSSLRKYDGGVMELGLEYTDKMAIPPGLNRFQLSGYCITECTAVGLPKKGITVFASQLHTHLLGTQVYTKHVRKGVELPELNRDNHYSTHFQEIRKLKQLVQIYPYSYGQGRKLKKIVQPKEGTIVLMAAWYAILYRLITGKSPALSAAGDAFITTCTYDSRNRSNITLGGFSISDEMCVNYIHYYPKTNLEVCKSSVSYKNLLHYFDYLHRYENQNTSSEKSISQNYKAIEWTLLRTEVLNDLYIKSRISMQCNQSSGENFPGDWEDASPTKIYKPLKIKPKSCYH